MGKPEFFELLAFHLGPLSIGPTVLTTWLLMGMLTGVAWLGTRKLKVENPSRLQTSLEGVLLTLQQAIEDTAPGQSARLLPFIGTLWLFIGTANLMGLVPGLRSPTGELSLTAALALLVFFAVHWFGIRIDGIRTYLRHYLDPNPLLLPFNLLSEITPHDRARRTSFRQHDEPGNGSDAGVTGGGFPRTDTVAHAAYRRSAGAGLYFRHAGFSLCSQRLAVS
ncbi:MAG: F0F1 ATP synthase subunit A [Nitrosomonadales bacterium]